MTAVWNLEDTIAAVASPPGGAMRGIVRLCGPEALTIAADLLAATTGGPASRSAMRRDGALSIAGLSNPLPASVYQWPDHRSYAGQPTVEIHTIGSPPILEGLVHEFVTRGARIARPGEFTLRAFLAGKIDLVQAEAVLGVINADGADQLQQALDQLSGGISTRMHELRDALLIDLADLEAGLDFVDEDIEFVDRAAMTARIDAGIAWLTRLLEHAVSRGRNTSRFQVVLAGLPNAGKSTLFNALVGDEAAIVSPAAGTTRDWLTASIDLDGVSLDLFDTAGIEATTNEISTAAQKGLEEQGRIADLLIWCTAADSTTAERQREKHEQQRLSELGIPMLQAITKMDRVVPFDRNDASSFEDFESETACSPIEIAAREGLGLFELRNAIRLTLLRDDHGRGELLTSTLSRCQSSLETVEDALQSARALAASAAGDELIAIELRLAVDALGEIVGAVYTDDLLDRIFSRFCIGK